MDILRTKASNRVWGFFIIIAVLLSGILCTRKTENSKCVDSLTELPREIGNCTGLTTLYINSNALTGLPAELANLTNVTSFVLGQKLDERKLPPAVVRWLDRYETYWRTEPAEGDISAQPADSSGFKGHPVRTGDSP